ncbi:uncharacterized protein LOC125837518 [Solanum verrucosum]|uniref:uncharacterized protein LOC125837518 n=1 Tax=Solanum verrucosum TaxID=315347 RepID=UPI0020D1CF83|nr:uncharacterized protein LOC125837518 [Solanum verrucosum]
MDSLATKIVVCECGQEATKEVTTLKANVATLRSDVDQLKSTNMSMIFRMVEIPDVPEMPPATTRDEIRVEETYDPKSEVDTYDKMLGVVEEASYEGLTETEVPSTTPGIDAQTDGATE